MGLVGGMRRAGEAKTARNTATTESRSATRPRGTLAEANGLVDSRRPCWPLATLALVLDSAVSSRG